MVHRADLGEDGLRLAASAEVALEALAEAGGVVAEATAGAVAAEVVALAEEDVRAGGALLKGAVRATGAKVTDAANVLEGVPGLGVGLGGLVGELLLLDAAAAAVAVGGAHGTLAGLAVAHAFHGALDLGVGAVVSGGVVDPGGGLGAGAHGAIVIGPRGVGVLRAGVAGALVVV